MKFNFNTVDVPFYSADPYYELALGDYIDLEELLADPEQVKLLKQAIETVQSFLEQAEQNGVIKVC